MKFFNLDLHIGVIGDIKTILLAQGHEVTDWTISGHAWVLGRQRDPVDVINHLNWRNIDEVMCAAFYKRYKDELSHYDCFIVTHTPCFALLFKAWQKPIIVVASTRFEHPFTGDPTKWSSFNDFLRCGIDEGIIIPLANNKYDAAYAEYFTARPWKVIPSICEYTGIQYQPDNSGILYWSRFPLDTKSHALVDKSDFQPGRFRRALNRLPFLPKHRGFNWADIGKFNGIVHIPYNVSVMSIFEHYTANIPLFFPSKNLLMDLAFESDLPGALSEISFNQVFNLPPASAVAASDNDPNNFRCRKTMENWLDLADFYDDENMPFITYFDSLDAIKDCIRSVDLKEQSTKMQIFNEARKTAIYKHWDAVISEIPNRKMA
jgi:hypothetical protein